jgi:hypothetical protein
LSPQSIAYTEGDLIMRSPPMKPTLFALSILLAAGCSGQTEQPLIQGPLRWLEVKTGENSREGDGNFNVPVHGKLYRDYLLVTYSSGTKEEHTEVFPANRLWKVDFGTTKVELRIKVGSGGKPAEPPTSPPKSTVP